MTNMIDDYVKMMCSTNRPSTLVRPMFLNQRFHVDGPVGGMALGGEPVGGWVGGWAGGWRVGAWGWGAGGRDGVNVGMNALPLKRKRLLAASNRFIARSQALMAALKLMTFGVTQRCGISPSSRSASSHPPGRPRSQPSVHLSVRTSALHHDS